MLIADAGRISRLKILATSFLFPNSLYPNRGIFVLNRLKAVSKYVEVKVINPVPWFPLSSRSKRYHDYDRIPRKETIDGIEVFHPRFFSVPFTLKSLTAGNYCRAVAQLARRLHDSWRFQVVDMHWTFPDLVAGRELQRCLGCKQIITVRGVSALSLNEQTWRAKEIHRLLPGVDRVITLSNILADHCRSIGVPKTKITTIRNGVDSSRFRFIPQNECRQTLGLPSDQRIILGIGYLTPNKGFDRIIKALPELNQRFGPTSLYLIGPDGSFAQGDCSSTLFSLAKSLGLDNRVHFAGSVANDQLMDWYNAADCFCLSSHNEGCPNVVLEALASGCPVVATDVGAVSEIISDDFLGRLTPNSADGVQNGLVNALGRIFVRDRIAKHMKTFDWDWCAQQVINVYDSTIGQIAAPIGA